jgi:N-acetylglucosaminyldiphosphoundecaprenol N-acetyl-beta-D-mannosaminyltransferase
VTEASLAAVGGHAPTQELLGIPITALTEEQVLDLVDRAVETRTPLRIGVVNAAKIVNMRRDPVLRRDVLSSDIILADGIAVVWAARALGSSLPERVAGISLMAGILRRGHARGYRVFCLGASGDVLERTVARMAARYPGVSIVGSQHGYFPPEQEEDVARAIAEARPDVLFVAMTSPRKEMFLARWSKHLDVPVFHGVGGSFDVVAGKVRRAPPAWQRKGLEWLYRMLQEPKRLTRRYLVTNTLFCGMVLSALLRRRFPQRGERSGALR